MAMQEVRVGTLASHPLVDFARKVHVLAPAMSASACAKDCDGNIGVSVAGVDFAERLHGMAGLGKSAGELPSIFLHAADRSETPYDLDNTLIHGVRYLM